MICFVFVSSTYVFGTLLTANGNLKQLNMMAACGMVLNISLNLLLIPIYKASGAAFASLVTQFCTAIFQILIAYKYFNFKVNYKFLSQLIVYLLATILCGIIVRGFDLQWMIQLLILSSLSIAIALLIGLFSIKGLLHIIRYGE